MNANELLAQRAKHVADMRALLAQAEGENRDLNDTETSQYEKLEQEVDSLKARADRIARSNELKGQLEVIEGNPVRGSVADAPRKNKTGSKEYKAAFEQWAQKSSNGVNADVMNALQVGTNSEGGYIVPEEFETMIVEHMQDWNDFRGRVNLITTSSDRNIPIEDTLGAAAYTAEEAAYNESDAAFSQKVLGAYKATTILKVSEELLQDSFTSVESYLARNFGKRFGLRQEQSIVAGTGSSQPNSLLSGASDSGITFAGTAAITADELINLYHGLSRPYRANAVWVMNDATVLMLRKLKDSDGQYIWQPGLQAGVADRLLGKEVVVSQFMPTAAASAKSVIFGDLSKYTWAERTGRVFQRLNELYSVNGQIGFKASERHDGVVVDTQGIVFGDQAAS